MKHAAGPTSKRDGAPTTSAGPSPARVGPIATCGDGGDFPGESAAARRAFPDDAGFCLVDASGRIVATDDVAADFFAAGDHRNATVGAPHPLAASPGFAAAFERVLGGEAVVEVDRGPSAGEQDHGARITLRRLTGATGPLVQLEIRRPRLENTSAVLDALTQLPDRRAVAERAAAWRRAATPAAPRFAVLFLDLDGFKSVNDRHGHAVGDEVLKALAERWLRCVREGDLVARYGGDEFVLLIRDAAIADDVAPVIRRLREVTAHPLRVGDLSLTIDAAIGWSAPEHDGWTIEELVAAADRDMYARKRACVTLGP